MRRLFILLNLLCVSALCHADRGRIEITTLAASDTVDKLHSFSSYSSIEPVDAWQLYGGMELAWIRLESADDLVFNPRVLLGFMPGSRVSPFIEMGTNLADLLDLLSGDTRDCSQDQCNPDVDLKLGLRIGLDEHFTLGLFYQAIHFGDFHDLLEGDHDIYGINLGYRL